MRRRPGSQPTRTITHPNDPTISVIVRQPKRVESRKLNDILANNRRALLIYDKDGKVAKDDNGDDKVYIDQLWPWEAMIESLKTTIVEMRGLFDEKENAIVLDAEKESVAELAESWLDVEIEEPLNGKPTKVGLSFANYIARETRKASFFDADPLASNSATQ